MTPRSLGKVRIAAVFLVAGASLIAISGCDPRAARYFLQPFEPTIPAPGPSLEDKKVVILCNATSGSLAEFPSLERDFTREFSAMLEEEGQENHRGRSR